MLFHPLKVEVSRLNLRNFKLTVTDDRSTPAMLLRHTQRSRPRMRCPPTPCQKEGASTQQRWQTLCHAGRRGQGHGNPAAAKGNCRTFAVSIGARYWREVQGPSNVHNHLTAMVRIPQRPKVCLWHAVGVGREHCKGVQLQGQRLPTIVQHTGRPLQSPEGHLCSSRPAGQQCKRATVRLCHGLSRKGPPLVHAHHAAEAGFLCRAARHQAHCLCMSARCTSPVMRVTNAATDTNVSESHGAWL